MRSLGLIGIVGLLAATAACSSYTSEPKLEYYRGQNIPQGYIQVVRAEETEVEFRIQVDFQDAHRYHLILDGNRPVAEGWFPTRRVGDSQAYHVVLKTKKDRRLDPGKTYRLCIGGQNPEAVQLQSSSYRCLVDFEFVFQR